MSAGPEPLSAAEVWDTILAPKFARFREVLVQGAEPHGRSALARWAPPPGARAIDVGCGFGESTFELAAAAGPGADVTGVDIARTFVDVARADARARAVANVRFVVADVADLAPPEPFDYVFSRFGTMFFERPIATFRELRAMTRRGGRLVMTTWRRLAENPWLSVAKEVARAWLPKPGPRAIGCGPGPFSLADPDVVREVLLRAGYAEVAISPCAATTRVGLSLEDAVDFQLAIGPAGEIVREAGAQAAAVLPDLRHHMARALEPFLTAEGVLMPSAAWVVHARA